MIYNANQWQSINKTNQESKCTYSCAGQKLTSLFSIHCYIRLFYLTCFSTRPLVAIVRPLQVKFELLNQS